jgi:hypothetical protein
LALTAAIAASLAILPAMSSNVGWAEEPATVGKATTRPSRNKVKIPGLVINLEKRCVDVESSICLDQGFLELIACTKGTKEQESIVAIEARPMHVHAALLLIGVRAGNRPREARAGAAGGQGLAVR